MKEKIKLIIFAIVVFIIAFFISKHSIVTNFLQSLEPTDYVAQEILYKNATINNSKYTLNIYTNISSEDFAYNDEGNLVKSVTNYAPNKIKTNIKQNNNLEAQQLISDLKLKTDRFAVLLDEKGYVLSVYSYPYDKQVVLSNLTNIANFKN